MDTSRISDIKQSIIAKSSLKQDIFSTTKAAFADLKEVLGELSEELRKFAAENDARVVVELKTIGQFEIQFTLGGDTIIFQMHTNVFYFPGSHLIFKNPYASAHPSNAYCGIINVYNFLTDSFRYQRTTDVGYLVGRIFINHEKHFFVEGYKQIGYLFNDFASSSLDKTKLREISEIVFQYVLDFDLYTPPYHAVKEVTLEDIQSKSQELMLKTGKRLGFRFQSDFDDLPH